MQGLERGSTVAIEDHDARERASLARSIGRRPAHRSFETDQRDGGSYLSVRVIEPAESQPGRRRKPG